MSYGVLASKVGHVRVERLETATNRAPLTAPWSAGRVTLTALHLNFNPTRAAQGVTALTVALCDVETVGTSSGRIRKVVSVRTADLVVQARVAGAAAFAKQVATSAEAARKRQG